MSKIANYYLRVLKGVRLNKIKGVINSVHKKCGKNKALTFLDIIWCFVRYRAGYMDYELFEFFNCTGAERKTYVTRFKNRKLIERFNNPEFDWIFDKKSEFDKHFKDFLGREFLPVADATPDNLAKFAAGK
ncbi:MAG: hypothetical protein LBM65_05120, partial [Oscillospiraceae bacterium]|nr:hypothetical protein [Oscillospiraceae bacterium]